MRFVAAAIVASRTVAPHEESIGRTPGKEVEPEPVVETAKRRRTRRRVDTSDAWKPTHARP
jgi:hypothetical protein